MHVEPPTLKEGYLLNQVPRRISVQSRAVHHGCGATKQHCIVLQASDSSTPARAFPGRVVRVKIGHFGINFLGTLSLSKVNTSIMTVDMAPSARERERYTAAGDACCIRSERATTSWYIDLFEGGSQPAACAAEEADVCGALHLIAHVGFPPVPWEKV